MCILRLLNISSNSSCVYKRVDVGCRLTSGLVRGSPYLKVYPETPQYVRIEKAIAYLREGLGGESASQKDKNELDAALMDEVLGDLEELINRTENVMETSEAPIDDLSQEEIER